MKLIIDIDEKYLDEAQKGHICLSDIADAVIKTGKPYEDRPKGKWEYTDGRWGLGDWRCSKCGGYSDKDTHYCPNCGRRMKK